MAVSVPGLILIDRYYCWNCGHMTIREELVEERKLTLLYGEPPPIRFPNVNFVLGPTAADQNVLGLFSLSTTAFTPIANELVVACIAHTNVELPTSVMLGSTPMIMAASESDLSVSPGEVFGSIWYLPNAPRVSAQVTATFNAALAAVIIVRRFYELTSLSHSTSEVGVAPLWDTGITPPQTSIGHLAVAMVATNNSPSEQDPPLISVDNPDFASIEAVGAYSSPGVLEAACAVTHRFIMNTDPAHALGSHGGQPNNVAVLQVFKP